MRKREEGDDHSTVGEVLSAERAPGRAARSLLGAERAREGGSALRAAAGARLHGQAHNLRGTGRAREPRRGGLPEARRQARRSRRPLPAEHASLRHRVFRRAESRRDGRQLLAPGRAADARAQGQRQRDRHPCQSRPRLALSASREAARFDASQNAGHWRIRRDDAGARSRQSADGRRKDALRGDIRRAPYRVPRSHRQRRPPSGLPARRAHRRSGRDSIYRRHDRLAQGRDADARQSDRGLLALYRGDDPQRRGLARRRGAFPLRPAAVPHLFADGRHAARL